MIVGLMTKFANWWSGAVSNRRRWCSDRKENAKCYAEKMEHQWTEEMVLPNLQRAYPSEAAGSVLER
jgi:hypothetical protein